MKGPLSIRDQLAGAELIVFGGTGFLGKVWLAMVLDRFPEVGRIHLVVRERRDRHGNVVLSSEERFWSQVATSEALDPVRARHGDRWREFLAEKVHPIPGDVEEPHGGVPAAVRDALRGKVTALVNAAGLVDFNPPLDHALNANAFGMQNLVALVHDLGDVPFLHTSTCYVAGGRTGEVPEVDPLLRPFPRADELDVAQWDPGREIAECVELVEHVRHRTNDAFRQAAFREEAERNLTRRGEPSRGTALDAEIRKVRDKYESARLSEVGMERATFWGWHNTYTYTKSIGEQVLARSGVRFTIVRPAVIESAVAFPKIGWNEGINTSAPVLYLGLKGLGSFPTSPTSILDVIPVDHVAAGMIIALAELLDGTHEVVYQLGSSDTNPLYMPRFIEIVALYKREKLRAPGRAPWDAWLARLEPTGTTADAYVHRGPRFLAGWLKTAAETAKPLARTPLGPVVGPATQLLGSTAKQLEVKAAILDQFLPFMATHTYRFATHNVRAGHRRLNAAEQALVPFDPETIDWRHYMTVVHVPGLEEHVFPLIDEKITKPKKAMAAYDDLVALLEEVGERYEHQPALMRTEVDGLSRVTFAELRDRALATAARLSGSGLRVGERVIVAGRNHPDWPIAWFGVIAAGGVVVPLDPELDPDAVARIVAKSGARFGLVDAVARARFTEGSGHGVTWLELRDATAPGAGMSPVRPAPDDLAAVLFTSGTTGDPKGVMLTHRNFTALIGSLASVFPLTRKDRVLSVLPLHHTFEFTCGLLLPLASGARIVYLDRVDGERLSYGLSEGRITAMVGVPALWQLLERRIRGQVQERGKVAGLVFDGMLELNRSVGAAAGVDLGRVLFASVHQKLGGNIRLLISGGAALPKDTHQLFQGLGLHLAEGYGLTEAAPVLSVALAGPKSKSGHVGVAVPGVTLKVVDPDERGVGEVVAKGPNVMKGYLDDPTATAEVIDADGWLRTGDLGRIDHKGRLSLAGRKKEVVVTASGENVYLDDVEARIGDVDGVTELTLVGVPDDRGGERLALLAVPEASGREGHERARASLKKATSGLPMSQQPQAVLLVDAPLPRTATRKVQRKEARKVVLTLLEATQGAQGRSVDGVVPRAVSAIANVPMDRITPATRLVADLGFDSLQWVELGAALSAAIQPEPDLSRLSSCETVGDVARLCAEPVVERNEPEDVRRSWSVPGPLREPLKRGLAAAQRRIYSNVLETRVTGRAFIPQNRPVIVVSNHASHLDMGLVKYALGPYGERIVGLAAADYFFEGHPLWVTYFEQLTNLAPLDRNGGFRASLDQALRVIDQGHVMLLFPEGGRQESGALAPFKPLVGKLALESGLDVLPLWLEGTHDVLPKGSFLPRSRSVEVRIGPPLPTSRLKAALADKKPADAARIVAKLAYDAVAALRDGTVVDPERVDVLAPPAPVLREEDVVAAEFQRLPDRFVPAKLARPLSWYFSLGGDTGPRYTVTVGNAGCDVKNGRPVDGKADCVVKTTPELMRRILQEAWLPGPPEFLSGAIKTNEIPLVIEFARVFDLAPEILA
jgi:long-chain acyl-CoA synthetase